MRLSILFMRFLRHFYSPSIMRRPFNSLYEILLHFMAVEMGVFLVFQFSLWDSIGFHSAVQAFLLAFNSLYEILSGAMTTLKRGKMTFNSLYEILTSYARVKLYRLMNFQFSLWDSYEIYNRKQIRSNTFNSLYEILQIEETDFIGDFEFFQFSLWDS